MGNGMHTRFPSPPLPSAMLTPEKKNNPSFQKTKWKGGRTEMRSGNNSISKDYVFHHHNQYLFVPTNFPSASVDHCAFSAGSHDDDEGGGPFLCNAGFSGILFIKLLWSTCSKQS